jgi:hypothetical protein
MRARYSLPQLSAHSLHAHEEHLALSQIHHEKQMNQAHSSFKDIALQSNTPRHSAPGKA